jgi:signal transduction histidine kinase
MKQAKVAVSRLRSQLSDVQWRWVLLAGVGAPVITVVFWALVMFSYVIFLAILAHGPPDQDRIAALGAQVDWAAPVLTLALTVVAASWAARKAGAHAALHGALVGVVSGICGQSIGSIFDGAPELWQLPTSFLSIGAGLLGGLGAQSAVAGQEALYQSSRALAAARNPQAVVDAIGAHLAGPPVVQVGLWHTISQAENGAPGELELLASWAPTSIKPLPPGLRFRVTQLPALRNLRREAAISLQVDQLPKFGSEAWENLGVGSALLLPLIASDEGLIGLITVAARSHRGFSRSTTRQYLAFSAQAATVLENFRLVEQGRQTGVLAERQRLAHEIHDTLAQGFTSIVMHLEAAEQAMPANPQTALEYIDWARGTARESLAEARRVVWALRPEILEGVSLPEAIERLATRWSEENGVNTSTDITGTYRSLHTNAEVTLLRATQEALANVRKHAHAKTVAITLSYMDDVVALDVRDDGSGFDPDQVSQDNGNAAGGFGLAAMRERVEQQGGRMIVESAPGEGTTLVVDLPIHQGVSGPLESSAISEVR